MPAQSAKPEPQDLPFALSPEEEAELDRRAAMADDPNVPKITFDELSSKLKAMAAHARELQRQASNAKVVS